jgi:hypothetical protein
VAVAARRPPGRCPTHISLEVAVVGFAGGERPAALLGLPSGEAFINEPLSSLCLFLFVGVVALALNYAWTFPHA